MKSLKWLSVADRFTKSYMDERLAPLGINSSQHMYLLKVCDHPGISQDSLLNTVYVHPSNVVRMVAALEKKGFLTRTPCQQDKRTWQLYPTERALAIAEQIRAICAETEAVLLEGAHRRGAGGVSGHADPGRKEHCGKTRGCTIGG